MLGVDADHPDHAFALDNLAFVANLFNTSSDFHLKPSNATIDKPRRHARRGANRDYTDLETISLHFARINRL